MKFSLSKYIRQFLSSQRWNLWTSSLDTVTSRYRLGITIADDSLRLALVKTGSKNPVYIDGEVIPWPEETGDLWSSRWDIAVDSILRHLRKHRKIGIPVNIGLTGREIGLRRINLPHMPAGELTEAVRWESDKLFPYDISECILDHEIVGQHRSASGQTAVNITAANRGIILELLRKLTDTGIKIGQINFLPAIMVEALRLNESSLKNQSSLVLYLDRDQGMATFIRDGYVELHQEFIVKPIESSVGDGSLQNSSALMEELTSFMELYAAQGQGQNVDRVLMAGYFTSNASNRELFAEQLEIPITLLCDLNWWPANRSKSDQSSLPFLTTPVLSALAKPYPRHLAQASLADIRFKRQTAVCAVAAAVLALATVGVFYWTDLRTDGELTATLNQLQTNVNSIENSPAYLTYLAMSSKLALLNSTGKTDPDIDRIYSLLLKELSLKVPPQLNFKSMNLTLEDNQYVLGIDGVVIEDEVSPEIVLAQYVRSLDESPFFNNVHVISHGKKHSKGRFEINFQIKMGVNS